MQKNTLGKNLHEFREMGSLSQEQLGRKLGVNQRTVSNWEVGINDPCLDMVVKIADFFGISTDELLKD